MNTICNYRVVWSQLYNKYIVNNSFVSQTVHPHWELVSLLPLWCCSDNKVVTCADLIFLWLYWCITNLCLVIVNRKQKMVFNLASEVVSFWRSSTILSYNLVFTMSVSTISCCIKGSLSINVVFFLIVNV